MQGIQSFSLKPFLKRLAIIIQKLIIFQRFLIKPFFEKACGQAFFEKSFVQAFFERLDSGEKYG
jgi:hypothetical protein